MMWRGRVLLVVLMVLLCACNQGTASTPTPAAPAAVSPAPSVAPTATRAAAPATATAAPKPTEAPQPEKADTVWVGNTDGEGVYVRSTPAMADRVRAYADGTPLTIIGDDVDVDGQQWKHIRTPDGLEGYVPAMYTVDAPP
jgi:Bacterial SH3 domain